MALDSEIAEFVQEWTRAIVGQDTAAAARLREPGYVAVMHDGSILSRDEELSLLGQPELKTNPFRASDLTVAVSDKAASATFRCAPEGESNQPGDGQYRLRLELQKRDGAWRAVRATHQVEQAAETDAVRGAASHGLGARIQAWIRRRFESPRPTFEDLAFLASRPGEDMLIPRRAEASDPTGFPVPPKELWLGYNYVAQGATQVGRMLEILEVSGFDLADGDRILDLGCGAGRMIRHLADLAKRCEIWGADISSEHIGWCRQYLSPPFHFATTTKVPHLPFEDRSFAFVYCGSLFTHIDDLAAAWLLELHRILKPGGRLYVTIHDEHTLALLAAKPYSSVRLAARVRGSPFHGLTAHPDFDMFSLGRGHRSQVFYRREHFLALARPMFSTLSVTEQAYYYQTAVLMTRGD